MFPAAVAKNGKHKKSKSIKSNKNIEEGDGKRRKTKLRHSVSPVLNSEDDSSSGSMVTFFQRISDRNENDKVRSEGEETTSKKLGERLKSKKRSNMKKKPEKMEVSFKHNKCATSYVDSKDFEDSKISKKRKSKKLSEDEPQNDKNTVCASNRTQTSKNKIDTLVLLNDTDFVENKATEVMEVTSEEIKNAAKHIKNAFSLMMDNRHHIIGRNTTGKEAESVEESPDVKMETKAKLSTRKALFQNWADKKGAKKRKMVDDEFGVTIDYKLKKREKRFKHMLTKEKVAVHSVNVDSIKEGVIKRDSEKSERVKHCDDSDIVLLNSGTQHFIESIVSECSISSDNNETPNLKKSMYQTDLSSFFGSLDNNKTSTDSNKINLSNDNSKKLSKTKSGKKTIKDVHLNTSISDCFATETIDSVTSKTKKKWKMRLRLSLDDTNVETVENSVDAHRNNKNPLKPINANNSIDSDSAVSQLQNDVKITNGVSVEANKRNKANQSEQDLARKPNGIKGANKNPNNGSLKENQPSVQSTNVCTKTIDDAVKIAPVFLKAFPKPKVNEETLVARKQFLESGIPDKLKNFQEKQQKLLNRNFPIFPTISHIMVGPNEEQAKAPINFWNLPSVALDLKTNTIFTRKSSLLKLGMLTHCISSENINHTPLDVTMVTNCKEEIKKLKNENPNYPVRKMYKSLKLCSDAHFSSVDFEQSRNKLQLAATKSETKATQCRLLWIDLYKPCSSHEMYSNNSKVALIKKWLLKWIEFSFDINKNKRVYTDSDSSFDFENADIDNSGTIGSLCNTVIVCGPHGSGKSSAIHAICMELGIVVLESNASSKRTGKTLLHQLQHVTQSQELQGNVQDFLTHDKIKAAPKRMHLLLIEDVDIAFDQDENFASTVNHLIGTSRIPVILTTTDFNSLNSRKLALVHTVVEFTSVSPKLLAPWLQIVCLIEGVSAKKELITELLQECNGDVRATLLKLQFLIQSIDHAEVDTYVLKNNKEELNKCLISEEGNYVEECGNNYINVIIGKSCDASKPLDLGLIWWNIPQILGMPSPVFYLNEQNGKESVQINVLDSTRLLDFSNVSNIFAMTDLFYNSTVDSDLEPVHKKRCTRLKGSLEETYSSNGCYFHRDLMVEMSYILIRGCIKSRTSRTNLKLYRGLDEKRWHTKQDVCNDKFLEGVPLMYRLNSTTVVDYLSTLRTIAKSESKRANTNTKRGGRFHNYLSDLGVGFNDSILKTANNTFFSDV